ncbi:MAG: M20/M25/M40 family metallo-hydrolase, partial [Longimicrobiales bacterium]
MMKRLLTGALAPVLITAVSTSPLVAQSSTDFDRQVEQLMNHPAVRSALDHIVETDDQTMDDLMTLTEIPAPPFMEDERGAAFLQMMIDLGVDSAWTDEVGNAIGLRRGSGTGEVLAIAGHLDTVFPPETDVTIRVSGDTLFAPGIADDTRGLATVLAVLRAMNEADIRTEADVLFIGNVGEEGLGDLRGVKHLFRDGGPRIDHFISVD